MGVGLLQGQLEDIRSLRRLLALPAHIPLAQISASLWFIILTNQKHLIFLVEARKASQAYPLTINICEHVLIH